MSEEIKCLTLKEQEIYNNIIDYISQHGYCPSVRELADMCNLKSTSSVHHYLIKLFTKGYLETDCVEASPRAFRVVGYKFVKV